MSQHTEIQWADSTVNITSGCDGCELYSKQLAAALKKDGKRPPCYASIVHENRLARSFPNNYAPSFGDVRLIPGRMKQCESWSDLRGKNREDKPWLNGRPRIIFVSDMADALSAAVPFVYLYNELIAPLQSPKMIARGHQFLWLSKQPARMVLFGEYLRSMQCEWPASLWAGTSVTTQPTAELRIPDLLRVHGPRRRFVSYEPARTALNWHWAKGAIDLMIVGGESWKDARDFDVEWAYSILHQFAGTGVARFVKQLGRNAIIDNRDMVPAQPADADPDDVGDFINSFVRPLRLKDAHGGDWDEWPEGLRVREFPEDL